MDRDYFYEKQRQLSQERETELKRKDQRFEKYKKQILQVIHQ